MRSLMFSLVFSFALSAAAQDLKAPVDEVSPNIGGIGVLLSATKPFVQRPFGMARLYPITPAETNDRYLAQQVHGFPAGPATLMVSTAARSTSPASYGSTYDHDDEVATPYYYSARLETPGAFVEYTATDQAAIYRFTLPVGKQTHLVFSLEANAAIDTLSPSAVQGSERVEGAVTQAVPSAGETRQYFYAEFSHPLTNVETWQGTAMGNDSTRSGDHIGSVGDVDGSVRTIEVRVGVSYISTAQARRNLQREIPDWNFDKIRNESREVWNQALSRISVEGGTERQRTIFYTALYRSLLRMTDITEDGHYFSGYDHRVHPSEGHDFYTDDGLWDTFRSLHPLQLILDPKRQVDMVWSYVRMFEQSGWMPSFPSVAGEQAVMIGHHADQLILDTYAKGYRDFNAGLAFQGMRKNSTEATMLPWERGPLTELDKVYFDKGFLPALRFGETETSTSVNRSEKRQAVSVTLESSYDDWCVSEFAAALGKDADARYFGNLASNYRNLYDPRIGLMAPKDASGAWVEHFDPRRGGGQGGRDYTTEVNTWLATWGAQHDVAGLINLMGGRDAFNAKLDRVFTEPYGTSKFAFLGQFPDATGLVGMYAQGNEPSFHVPYLYIFSGQPWKTQRLVRLMMDLWYNDGPMGIPGDDDGGETSSWYVFSAMGFYPVTPGVPVYEIGSPIFSKTQITLANGKRFSIVANHVSAKNKYIQSATLNGAPLDRSWFAHSDLSQGGTLTLEMGDSPNTNWASAPGAAPSSMSREQVLLGSSSVSSGK
ncbi:GH92 family glycosyl hydrolase [Edaphobacter modestus]|uniref:Putative alpha-1,2-mannosidase n=1 Tax=Edaphobacter modestus TaxID=388466 RepID=A0A4Q7YEM3_9BACT|nr:GH92 family glycosyl hydrolase [Edaphobacter modestus]RZU35428.1 putative alpha-1,2-mannosidase [Edaphobacter modestus]